ncbi:aminotransferase class I/II-fold pyridoxal phosphate-dependent enzyme [Amycolatopsis sp. NPDC047767]|uniref:aminotransferase class I/II-fold pyridoxal phosphate-dependent enzyme n=1 Tax=Amycolatopsis sp. NPDC047767 TaxID=3156765 RepID=UPI00345495C0
MTTREIPAYTPGRVDSVTLSTNELAGGPLAVAVDAVRRAADDVHRYPDTSAAVLVEAIARHHGLSPDCVVVGAGAAEVLHRLGRIAAPDPADLVMFGWPGFEAYPVLLSAAGNGQQRIPLTGRHRLDLEAMLAAVTAATRVVVLCNPNNPTGTIVAEHDLRRFVDNLPSRVLVVLDEAYFGFDDGPDVVDGVEFAQQCWAAGQANVVAVRSFSKAYGLAGLRVGYAVASPDVCVRLCRAAVPFGVSRPAQEAAAAVLGDPRETVLRCRRISSDRAHLANVLGAAGYPVADSRANFLWLPLGDQSASFVEHCRAYGVAVLGYPEGVRVSIGTLEDNAVFARVADAYTPQLRPIRREHRE